MIYFVFLLFFLFIFFHIFSFKICQKKQKKNKTNKQKNKDKLYTFLNKQWNVLWKSKGIFVFLSLQLNKNKQRISRSSSSRSNSCLCGGSSSSITIIIPNTTTYDTSATTTFATNISDDKQGWEQINSLIKRNWFFFFISLTSQRWLYITWNKQTTKNLWKTKTSGSLIIDITT